MKEKKTALLKILFILSSIGVLLLGNVDAGEGAETGSSVINLQNKDYQGIVYTLNDVSMTAAVGVEEENPTNNTSQYEGYNGGNVIIPETVEKDGKQYTVTKIAGYAFAFANIYGVVLPDSVIEIGNNAFYQSKITQVDLRKVTDIGRGAFMGCQNLKYVRFGYAQDRVRIGDLAFSSCTSLEALYISGSLLYGKSIFSACHKLTCVVMDKDARLLRGDFFDSINLKYLILPDSLEYIPSDVLNNCKALKKLYIPPSVKMIGNGTLKDCGTTLYGVKGSAAHEFANRNGLTFIDTSDHIHGLKDFTFYSSTYMRITGKYCEDCGYGMECKATSDYDDIEALSTSGVKTDPAPVPIPGTFMLDNENKDYQGIVYTLDDSDMTAMVGVEGAGLNASGYLGYNDGNVILPEVVEKDGQKYTVTDMATAVFSYSRIKTLSISDGIQRIRGHSFHSSSITKIKIGRGVKEIDDYAFASGVFSLREFQVEEDNPYLSSEDGVLFDFNQETLIRYPPNKVSHSSVYVIPDTVKRIFAYAFEDTGIFQAVLSEAVESIDKFAFHNSEIMCMDLKNITEVGDMAFAFCKNLQWVDLGKVSNASMLDGSFGSCYALEAIYIPGTILFREASFRYCHNLQYAVMGGGGQLTEGEFSNCEKLECLILSDSLSSIPNNVLGQCGSLKKIYIPPSVKNIGDGVLGGCDTTIYGKAGSAAETFANKNGLKFIDVTYHTHNLVDHTYYYANNMKITGKYCEECGFGTECGMEIVNTYNVGAYGTIQPGESTTPTQVFTPTPAPKPTLKPTSTPTPTTKPTSTSMSMPTKIPMRTPVPIPPPTGKVSGKQLIISGFQAYSTDDKTVTLKWKKNKYANYYELYRSNKINKGYRFIRKVSIKSTTYIDKNFSPNKKYFYKVRAVYNDGRKNVKGSYTTPRSIKVTGLVKPLISVNKGTMGDGIKYLLLRLKRYSGKYVEIYFKTNHSKYKKLQLSTDRIKKSNRTFTIRYLTDYKNLHIKVRTYDKLKNKRVYSKYSIPVNIRLGSQAGISE